MSSMWKNSTDFQISNMERQDQMNNEICNSDDCNKANWKATEVSCETHVSFQKCFLKK